MHAVLMLAVLAQAPARSWGPEVAASAGYEWPYGDAYTDWSVASLARGAVPLRAELGARFLDRWSLVGYGEAALLVKSAGTSANTAEIPAYIYGAGDRRMRLRAGVLARFHLWPSRLFDATVGLGFGHEWLTASPLHGYEGSLHLGAELALGHGFFVGLELSASVGQYDWVMEFFDSTKPDSLTHTVRGGVHGWVGIVLRTRWWP